MQVRCSWFQSLCLVTDAGTSPCDPLWCTLFSPGHNEYTKTANSSFALHLAPPYATQHDVVKTGGRMFRDSNPRNLAHCNSVSSSEKWPHLAPHPVKKIPPSLMFLICKDMVIISISKELVWGLHERTHATKLLQCAWLLSGAQKACLKKGTRVQILSQKEK